MRLFIIFSSVSTSFPRACSLARARSREGKQDGREARSPGDERDRGRTRGVYLGVLYLGREMNSTVQTLHAIVQAEYQRVIQDLHTSGNIQPFFNMFELIASPAMYLSPLKGRQRGVLFPHRPPIISSHAHLEISRLTMRIIISLINGAH